MICQLDFAIQSRFLLPLILLNSENFLNDTNKLSDNQISVFRKWNLGQKKSPELFYFSKGKTSAAEITPQTRDSKTGVQGIQPSGCATQFCGDTHTASN